MKINEKLLKKLVNESVKRALREGWMEIPEINDSYERVLSALYEFEEACGELKESYDFVGYDDRIETSEFFMPDNDFEQIKMLLKKIRNDASKSRTRDIGRYKREDGRFYHKTN